MQFSNLSRKIVELREEHRVRIESLEKSPNLSGVNGSTLELEDVRDAVLALNKRVAAMKTEDKPEVVYFGGLILEDQDDARAWVESNFNKDLIGYVMDPHTICEHLLTIIKGNTDSLKSFGRIKKLAFTNLAQAHALSSYEGPIPKIMGSQEMLVVMNQDSHLDLIPSWEAWDQPKTGYREQFKGTISLFEVDARRSIRNELGSGTPGVVLATLSVKESVSFLKSLFQFMDAFHKHLATEKYSVKNAHHITTRLVRRILEAVFVPCQGVLATFRPEDPLQIASSMLWSQLSCLQIAMSMRNEGMENLEILSAELVQFLLINTKYDSIEQLEDDHETLKKELKDVVATKKRLDSALSTANNKISDLTKTVQALEKKVAKLG